MHVLQSIAPTSRRPPFYRETVALLVLVLYSICTYWPGVEPLHVELRGAEKLSFRERQVVVLKESGFAGAVIAARLGITEATVATLYRRARAKGYQLVIILDAGVLGIDAFDDQPEEVE